MRSRDKGSEVEHDGVVLLGIIQTSCGPDPEENLSHTVQRIREAAKKGAQIICLEELFYLRYFCQTEDVKCFDLAEPIPGPITNRLSKLSRQLKVVIVASIFERRAAGIYHNTAVVINTDGRLVGKYRKMHVPDDPHYHEKFYFTPGDLGFDSHLTSYGKIGVLICWDQWFPEAARLTALKGAQIIIYPTAIGWSNKESPKTCQTHYAAWEAVQRGHAISNGVFLAAVNRVGKEKSLRFWGQSFVSDPFGRILSKASSNRSETLVVPCDFRKIEKIRRQWPFLRDRRLEAYQDLCVRLAD